MRPTRRRNPPKTSSGVGGRRASPDARATIRRAARRLDEEPVQHEAEQDAQPAEHDERQPPAVVLADQAGEEAAADRADIDARLVQSHRPRARRRGRGSR